MVASLETEFGLFFVNYHSRVPFFNVRAPNAADDVNWQTAVAKGTKNDLAPFYRAAKSSNAWIMSHILLMSPSDYESVEDTLI